MTSSPDFASAAAPAVSATRLPGAWVFVIARAIPALAAAIAITFTPDHSPALGFVSFGAFGVLSGAAVIARAVWGRDLRAGRAMVAASGGVTVIAGVVAVAFSVSSLGTAGLVALLATWATLAGALELGAGIRHRRVQPEARDWRFAGAVTLVLAAAVLVVPPGFSQRFTGPDDIERALTASIIVVGTFGAYAAILGVFQIIAGLSLKWASNTTGRQRAGVAGNGSQS